MAHLPATPFMEAHYFVHDCFMTENQLLLNAGKLAGIPGIIVQGRYDLLCPPATSQRGSRKCGEVPRFASWKEPAIRSMMPASGTR